MLKRPSSSLAPLFAAIEVFFRRLAPSRPMGGPAGGPVVFRHYL